MSYAEEIMLMPMIVHDHLLTKMEITEQEKTIITSRAKEIDTGAVPLPMSNVVLGLPMKPDPTADYCLGACSESWSFEDLVCQKKLVADLTVDITSTGKIWEFHNTWENVLEMHFTSNLRRVFGLKSWNLNFLFEFRSNFQQVGQLCLFYTNLPDVLDSYHFRLQDHATDPYADYVVQTQLPHRKIPMGEDQDCLACIKWLSPHTASFGVDMYQNDGNHSKMMNVPYYDMGRLKLYVPFGMQVATGVDSTMNVRVWSWLSNFTYGAYRPHDAAL